MHLDLLVALAGLIVGFTVGLTGMGGGALMTPVLVLLFHVQPLAAVSSDLVASMIMKPVGAAVHLGRRTVVFPLVGWLAVGSVPGAVLGVVLLHTLAHGAAVQSVVQLALGGVLILAVAALLARWVAGRRRPTAYVRVRSAPRGPQPLPIALTGAITGIVVGLTSVGSGTLVIVVLLLLQPSLRPSQTVGTDLAQAIPMVGAAALAHIAFGDLALALTISIVIGSVPGVLLGSLLSARVNSQVLRGPLCVVLLLSALKLLGVSTLAIGIVLLAALVLLPAAWLLARAGKPARDGYSPTT